METEAGRATLTPSGEMRAVEDRGTSLANHDLRSELVARLLALTGHCIPPEDIHANGENLLSVAALEGATFRLHHHGELALSRPCDHCGTGRFESPEITGPADLGYALAIWKPTHESCEDHDSEDLAA